MKWTNILKWGYVNKLLQIQDFALEDKGYIIILDSRIIFEKNKEKRGASSCGFHRRYE